MSQTITVKQRAVLAKIADLTHKNGAHPTLEELRIALDYSSISSVQRHTDALKKKGYLDQNVRGLSLYRIRDVNTIFTLRNEQLGLLDSQLAVAFFRDLLWAEARMQGVPLNKVKISLWANVPDGGIDASVTEDEAERVRTSGLIKAGASSYQIKTGASFKPWQQTAIKKELFGRKHPNKENLGPSIKACLEKNGTYILACLGKSLMMRNTGKLLMRLSIT